MAGRDHGTESARPPQLALYQIAIGHYFSRALGLFAKLGIADLLAGGPRPVGELAAATDTHAPSLQRVLRLLVTVGVFEEREPGTFATTSIGECLRADVPGSARAMVRLFAGDRTLEGWKELEYCVRTGNPVYRMRGLEENFSEIAKNP